MEQLLGKLTHLLPALPDEFATGSITELKARGGYSVDLEWADGQLVKATITKPAVGETPRIRLVNDIVDVDGISHIRVVDQ